MAEHSEAARAAIRPVKEQIEDDLISRPGVVGVDIGEKITKGKPTGKLSIVVYVEKKKPVSQVAKSQAISRTILCSPIVSRIVACPPVVSKSIICPPLVTRTSLCVISRSALCGPGRPGDPGDPGLFQPGPGSQYGADPVNDVMDESYWTGYLAALEALAAEEQAASDEDN